MNREHNMEDSMTEYLDEEDKKVIETNDNLSSDLTSPFDEPEDYSKYNELMLPNVGDGTMNENNYNNSDYLLMNSTNHDLDKPKLDDITSSTFGQSEMSYDELYVNGHDSKEEEYTHSINGYVTPESIEALHRAQELLREKEAAVNEKDRNIHTESVNTTTTTSKIEPSTIDDTTQEVRTTMPQTTIKELVTFRRPGTIVVTTSTSPMPSSTTTTPSYLSSKYRTVTSAKTIPADALTTPSSYSDDPNDKFRTVRRKERNRIAAKRCRQRKAEYVHDLERQIGTLQHQIDELQDKLKQLQKENEELLKRPVVNEPLTYDLRHKKIERRIEE